MTEGQEIKLATILIEDKAQKDEKHTTKHSHWENNGVFWGRYPLPCGDYILANEKVLNMICRKHKKGIKIKKMDFLGTYRVAVDTKENILEIARNICSNDHKRFSEECFTAKDNGIKLIFLIENEDGLTSIDELPQWVNPRLYRYNKIEEMHSLGKWKNTPLPKGKPTSGVTLYKAMKTMERKYGVEFKFCTPEESGQKIVELLEGNYGK